MHFSVTKAPCVKREIVSAVISFVVRRAKETSASHMASSCTEQRQSLLECLADSPCILAGRSIKECVKLTQSEDGCRELNQAFFECKRGQVILRLLSSACPYRLLKYLSMRARHRSSTCASGSRGTGRSVTSRPWTSKRETAAGSPDRAWCCCCVERCARGAGGRAWRHVRKKLGTRIAPVTLT